MLGCAAPLGLAEPDGLAGVVPLLTGNGTTLPGAPLPVAPLSIGLPWGAAPPEDAPLAGAGALLPEEAPVAGAALPEEAALAGAALPEEPLACSPLSTGDCG